MGLTMGSYLSKPVTDKESTDESNDKLTCGASSMQGWRVSQEDAHNCLLDYDNSTSFFAVYDGHGGQEVAQYCAQKLPDFIKNTAEYKETKIEDALVAGFLGFDATIATDEVVEVLKELAEDKDEAEESDEEENVNNLYEEAAMPIEQVIEKYTSNLNPAVRSLKKDDKFPKSPYLKAKKESDSTVGTSSSSCSSTSSSSSSSSGQVPDGCGDGVSSSSEAEANDQNSNDKATNGPQQVPDSSDTKEAAEAVSSPSDNPTQNGEISTPGSEAQAKNDVSSTSAPVENGAVSKKGKGKAVIKPEPVKSTRPKRNAQQLYKEWLDFGEDSEDSDEEDQTFEGSNEETSDEDGEGVNTAIEVDGSEESSADEEEDDDEDDSDDKEDDGNMAFSYMTEKPGSDSGCTAVVALLKANELFVANAGDSRCIVCRNGTAVEMSFDHKPEDKPEIARIVKAGGTVTCDGRVNGGLNLSRAIGDHAYKQNKKLSDREQMITALPDVKTLTIGHEDEFMVLACDGIWNSMSSQEVVDFVRPRILEGGREKLSQICEEMFDHCLAPDTLGDGTGCDNMTAIIVRFKSNVVKRPASPPPAEETDPKRAKTDEESEAQIDTTV